MSAETTLPDEIMEKVVAFVDREAGHGAPLDAGDEVMVCRLIEDDPSVRALAHDLRVANAGLDTLLDDVDTVEVSGRLVAMIRAYAANDVAIADVKSSAKLGETSTF